MNKLEEQIEGQASKSTMSNTYKRGAQFVIDLELPVKFWRWMQHDSSAKGQQMLNSGSTIHHIFEWWIENIYGR